MDKALAMWILAGVCVTILFLILLKQKMQFLLEFLLRTGVGAAIILVVNNVFLQWGIPTLVGLNFWSLLTSGILGIPGVAVLFVVSSVLNL